MGVWACKQSKTSRSGMQPTKDTGHAGQGACQVFQTLPLEWTWRDDVVGWFSNPGSGKQHHDPVAIGSCMLHGTGQRHVVPRSSHA